ncbi:MAG: hypothetical protein EB078_05975 [Proteobacteria bacterium]|nr:hypothetical protein [Pseudomonadota bacterium]NDC23227.1 hypothetical protein [Pseudomonadota bacterium]NDD04432.1 hypothetical protein [Pseudomonadota bacterium]NDG27696.1 hypothetical protein [Pseudomonadota bacterium]
MTTLLYVLSTHNLITLPDGPKGLTESKGGKCKGYTISPMSTVDFENTLNQAHSSNTTVGKKTKFRVLFETPLFKVLSLL